MRVVGQQLAPRVVYVCNSGSVVCKCVMLNIYAFRSLVLDLIVLRDSLATNICKFLTHFQPAAVLL